MEYTPQTLAQAKRLFLEPKSRTTSTPPDRRQYSFRKRSPTTAILTSWIDEDCTDDYDPKIERAQLRQKRLSKRPKTTPSLIVTVHMASEAGKAFLASLPIYQDDGPDAAEPPTADNSHILEQDELQAQTCKACRDSGPACSLVQNPDAFPCEQCIGSTRYCKLFSPGIDPTFQINTQELTSFGQDDANTLDPDVAEPVPNTISTITNPTDSSTLRPFTQPQDIPLLPALTTTTTTTTTTTRTIHTSLTHPITFTFPFPSTHPHQIPTTTLPCHFCTNFTYALFGTGPPQTIPILDLGHGTYIPLPSPSPSPNQPPPPPTRICPTCALSRLHILRCPTHHIIPIKGFSPTTFDFPAAYATLIPFPTTPNPKTPKNPWCTLCPHPAFFGCSTPQTQTIYLEPITDPTSLDAKGCGLLLCERCEVLMRIYGGSVEEVVRRNRRDDGVIGGRADVEFLVRDNGDGGNVLLERFGG
ncbi:putative C6 finger domain protein [Aspergillus ibericus CBS 121593]|uniref:Zn(2)-C6 fungal-type domain-containing protein n=1 Tax=Aspergillus ibericus CBS 121593 TaxID=1448316 RepID=A0A395GT36_9EURO|nr:hypothetical protein BO80DRAFT_482520 [Aspergillus ibericus CBS 121593]RAK97253.1 hypothetical protein BO80DRAFT_482520 [Aspergillus ibericus CBS 121593]